jgi:hypothetical protein
MGQLWASQDGATGPWAGGLWESRRGASIPSANLFAWFRKGVGQVNNSGLDSWADQTANGRNLATVGGTKGTVNGDGTVTWAANGYIETASWTAPTVGMIYCRMRLDSRDATDQRPFFSYGVTAADNVAARSTGIADGQILLRASVPVYSSGRITDNNPNLVGLWVSLAIRINGASSLGKESGGTASSTFTASNAGARVRLAGTHNDATRGNVTIAELAMYDAVHDDATMDSILTYLDTL